MTPVDALVEALQAQVGVVARVQPSQLEIGSACAGWSVRDVLNHSIGVTKKFTDFAAGVTDTPHTPDGDLLGTDHRFALVEAADAAAEAWADADMTRTCDLSFGSFSAEVAAGINLFDVLAHTWDIAVVVDEWIDCGDDVWEAGLEAARQVIGKNRDPRHYAREISTAASASPRSRLLAFLGRDPATAQ